MDPVQQLRDALAKTTPGEWESHAWSEVDENKKLDLTWAVESGEEPRGHILAEFADGSPHTYDGRANSEFCAIAHNLLPEVLERLERAEAELESAEWASNPDHDHL